MYKKVFSIFLSVIMIFGLIAPVQTAEVSMFKLDYIQSLDYNDIAYISFVEPLSYEEIIQIHNSVLDGEFIQSRSAHGPQVEYLGYVDGLHHVITIKETVSTLITYEGDSFEESVLTIVGLSGGGAFEGWDVSPTFGIRATGRFAFVRRSFAGRMGYRITSYAATATALDSHHSVVNIDGGVGQVSSTGFDSLGRNIVGISQSLWFNARPTSNAVGNHVTASNSIHWPFYSYVVNDFWAAQTIMNINFTVSYRSRNSYTSTHFRFSLFGP